MTGILALQRVRRVPLLACLMFITATLGFLAWTGVASAASFTVTTTNDSYDAACAPTLCSLRDAIVAADAAGTASTITLPAGTYKLTIPSTGADNPSTGDLDIDNSASVTINGAGSGSTVIDANGFDRAFAVQNGAGLTLSGVTIEHGNPSSSSSGSQNGGAIYSDGALTLNGDVTLSQNAANNGTARGGAIFSDTDQTVLSLTGAKFVGNTAEDGGAIFFNSVQGSITNSTFTSNNASSGTGGAIEAEGGNLTVAGSIFTGNTSGYGGAIDDDTYTGYTLMLTNNSFVANTAAAGGALAYDWGDLTASGNTFTGNSATTNNGSGGAIYQNGADSTATASVYNNTFDHNVAYGGGALDNAHHIVKWLFYNNTLTDNQASGAGDGIYAPGNVGTGSSYANNIVAGNVGGDCAGTAITAAQDPGNNLDGDGSCFGQNAGDLTKANPELGQLADNGGGTETYALLAGSPAIDAGNDAQCPATDQRGVARPQGAHCDIGAFEAAAASLALSDTAPASATTNVPFTDTVKVTDTGPGPSTTTTVTDQLPAGETLQHATPSQGSCSSSGSPAKVTCALGKINVSDSATVALLVSEANPGSVSDTAIATNDQGANVSAPATTTVVSPPPSGGTPPPSGGTPKAITGGHSHVTKHSARLHGTVSTGGQTTWYLFQYGRTRSLGLATARFKLTSSGKVAVTIRHLLAGNKYFFRLVAINHNGISSGAKHSFRTKKHHHA